MDRAKQDCQSLNGGQAVISRCSWLIKNKTEPRTAPNENGFYQVATTNC